MRPVDKSRYTDNQDTYTPYGDAKPGLIGAIGGFCSYCERQGHSAALDVEHIDDKNSHPEKKFSWDNFLLACKNCNGIKGTKSVDLDQMLMPHCHNTFSPFSYL